MITFDPSNVFLPGDAWRSLQEIGKSDPDHSVELDEKAEKEASDLNYPSRVPAETVYLLMSKNFPPAAISWVRRANWIGPIYVPWSHIDTENKESWAASHQPEKVRDFQKQIKAHDGHVAPSVLVRQKTGKSFIVDGHHRALAREELNQDVLAYIGTVNPGDYQAATETHAKQIHSGSDPQNKMKKVCWCGGLHPRNMDEAENWNGENLDQKVLGYTGNIDSRDRQAALETHSRQIHSGASSQNKAASLPKG